MLVTHWVIVWPIRQVYDCYYLVHVSICKIGLYAVVVGR